ncbi:MAG: hypothetical protein EOP53_10815 [Sphingobacteriales bacterium]|nr:MAG: hypothetical protein EOP53_10815 [Sphingobacteriales bacterium]
MKYCFLSLQIGLQIFLLVCFTSCKGQSNADSLHKSTNNFQSTQNVYPKIKRYAGSEICIFRCSFQDKNGNLWFGTSGGAGMYRYDGKEFANFHSLDGKNNSDINVITADSAGNLLFATGSGIFKYDGKTFNKLTEQDDQSKKSIAALLVDKKGNVWFSTMQNGVYCYNGKTFTNYLTGKDAIMDIMEDKARNIWFSFWQQGGVWKYDGKNFTNYRASEDYYLRNGVSANDLYNAATILPETTTALPQENITDDMIFSIAEDIKGNIWFATRRHGACKFDGKSFLNFTANKNFANVGMYDILEDKNGKYWFATEKNGVWRYDGKSFKNFNTGDGLINNSVFDIMEDNAGNLWFGTRGFDLYRYDGRRIYSVTE